MDPETIHRRRWSILGVLCLSLIMVVLGNSVLNVAIPTLGPALGASTSDLQWIVDAYALVFGGLLLTMGALGDRFGRRGALQLGLAIVGISSVAATFADSVLTLIIARAVMGLGAALVMPATLSILTHVFAPDERGKALGIWAAFAGIGGAIGPVVGGALLESFNWPSIFWLNVPVVVIAMVAGLFLIPTSRDPHQTRLDPVGSLLSIVALASLLFAIIEGPSKGWSSIEVITGFAVAAVTWPAFVFWELRTPHPMLPMRFFSSRGFSMGNLALGLSFFVMFAFFFVMTQYLQFLRGFSPLEAGIRTLPLAAGLILAAPRSDKLVRLIGTPRTVTVGIALVAAAFFGLSFVGMATPYWALALGFLGLGLGMGLAMAPSTTLIMDSIPSHKAGVGSAMNDTSREVGGAFGIAILGSIFNAVYKAKLSIPESLSFDAGRHPEDSIINAMMIGRNAGADGAVLVSSAQAAFLDAVQVAYLVGAAVALATAILVFLLMPRRADQAQSTGRMDSESGAAQASRNAPSRSPVAVSAPAPAAASRPPQPLDARTLAELHARIDAL